MKTDMKKFVIVPITLAFLFLFSCESDNCECTKRTFNYEGDYPTSDVEVVNCPAEMEDGDDIIEWGDDDKIDNVVSKTCI
jgi:hypothetical protein